MLTTTTLNRDAQAFGNLDGCVYFWQYGMRTYAVIKPNGDIDRKPLPTEDEAYNMAKDPDNMLGDFWTTVYVNHDFTTLDELFDAFEGRR